MFSRHALRSYGVGLVLGHAITPFADFDVCTRPDFATYKKDRSRYKKLRRAGSPRPRALISCAFVILFAFAPCLLRQARADDITTATGKVYHHAEVLSRNASAMLIRSDEGDTALSYDELKPADRDKYSKTLAKSIELPALTVIGEKPSFLEDTTRDKEVHAAQKEINKAIEEKKQAEAAKKEQPQQIKLFNGGVGLGLGGADLQPEGGLQPSYLGLQYQHLDPHIVEKDLKIFDDAINGKQ